MPIASIHVLPDASYLHNRSSSTQGVEHWVEQGAVLQFPAMPFALQPSETRFLDSRWADGKAKNISLRGGSEGLRGAIGDDRDLAHLQALLLRFRNHATALVDRLFPHYCDRLTPGNTSLRLFSIEGRATSWRQDDSRLHIDAFPSYPVRGKRLLRVFTNLDPRGRPRVWRVGETFEEFAPRFLSQVRCPWPGSAWWLETLRITKAQRSAYDHLMLGLHDRVKADLAYQRSAPQQTVDFMAGTTWVLFSDQVLHAAMAGQFMIEHTQYLDAGAEKNPATAPLQILQRLAGRKLL